LHTHFFHQPKPFWTLAFGELCSTFSYFGTQTILVLYCLHTFGLTQSDSYLLYGAYIALTYALPILGGIVADRWLGDKTTAIIGCGLNIAGTLLLMLPQHYLFCLGLATSLVGSGLYKSSATHLIGTLYPNGDIKKETGFTLLYLAINLGGVLGPLVYGLVVYALGWNFGFLCSALGIFISTIFLLKNSHLLEENKRILAKKSTQIFIYPCIISACLFLSLPFYTPTLTNLLVVIIFAISIAYLIAAAKKHHDQDRRRLAALLLMSFFGMFYFAAGLQIGSTITLFIQSNIQQGTIDTQLPASIFSTFYPLFVLLLAPVFTYGWRYLEKNGISVSAPAKLAIGMLLAALGISAFAFAAVTSFVMTGILAGNFLLGAGELAIAPAIYTAISNLSPIGMKSTMMGCWFLAIALGGYLSGVLANTSHWLTHQVAFHQSEYVEQFVFIACFTFMIALILTTAIPKLSKMMR